VVRDPYARWCGRRGVARLLPIPIDPELGEIIRRELTRHGVRILDRITVNAIEKREGKLIIRNTKGIPVEGEPD